jgi:hypothetical protein
MSMSDPDDHWAEAFDSDFDRDDEPDPDFETEEYYPDLDDD